MDTSLVMDIALTPQSNHFGGSAHIGRSAYLRFACGHHSGGNLDTRNDPQLHSKVGGYGAFASHFRRVADRCAG